MEKKTLGRIDPVSQSKTLWLVVTRTCNLACGYCYQGAENHERDYLAPRGLQSIMSKSVADRTLDWALTWAPQDLRVNLYGGEPTLAWPLISHVVPEWKMAFREKGKSVGFSITTNGTLLKGERRDFMDQEEIGLLLSLDGPPHVHNSSRPAKGGKPSWDQVDPLGLLAWRPNLEIAWALSPMDKLWDAAALQELVDMGFKRVNFNLDFLTPWSLEDQARLLELGKRAGRLIARGELQSNWGGKYITAGTKDTKMERPCGLATGMLAATPEGDLFPSQEMAFTVYEEGRAPGTVEHYRVGNVVDGLDPIALARVGILRVSDMRPPAGFDCNDCVAKSACIGGCHCRYVGQDGQNPASRMDIPEGHCPSMRAMMTGLMMGHWVERKLRPENAKPGPVECAPRPKDPAPVDDLPAVANLRF